MSRSNWILIPAILCTILGSLSFPLAILMPFFVIHPSMGDDLLDAAWGHIQPGSMDSKSFSVIGGIDALFQGTGDEPLVAVVLLLFSVYFPLLKLAMLWLSLVMRFPNRDRMLRVIEVLGPWSMSDVFVVSVFLIVSKHIPGGTTVELGRGYKLFLASVLVTLFATWLTRLGLGIPCRSAREPMNPVAAGQAIDGTGPKRSRHYADSRGQRPNSDQLSVP